MNILLVSEDVRLAEALERLGGFHKCYVLGEAPLAAEPPEELLASVGAVAVSERLLDIGSVQALKQRCGEKPIFFLTGNRQNTQELSRLRGLCAAHDIHCILPYRTVGQICSEVQRCFGANGGETGEPPYREIGSLRAANAGTAAAAAAA